MQRLKQAVFAATATAVIAFTPVAPALAGGHGFGHVPPFGLGRGLFGAAVALATLPIAIASAVVSAGEQAAAYPEALAYGGANGYAAPAPAYAPPAGYYAPPPVAYAPPAYYAAPAYYPRASAYYPAPRYYAPHPSYYGGYPARGGYRGGGYGGGGGYGHPHR